MLGVSFKSETDMILNPTSIFPGKGGWTLDNYAGFIIRDGQLDNVPKWMFNSLIIATCSIILTILVCSLAAYAFVFLRFKARTVLFTALIFTMTIPGVIGTTARYSIYAKIGTVTNLLNDPIYIYFWLIVPGTTGVFDVYLFRNALLAIPKDIVESARSDGASDFRIYRTIVMPIIRSTLLLIALFSFTSSWNSLLWPQLLLNGKDQSVQTITVALTGYTSQQDGWNAKAVAMATSAFSMIPIIIVFIFTQSKMIDGMATTGVKG
jgi:multiple sugar transport system permease protein